MGFIDALRRKKNKINTKSAEELFNMISSSDTELNIKALAFEQLEKSAEQNNPDALYYLGIEYKQGNYRINNESTYIQYIKSAADLGYVPALKEAGMYYKEKNSLQEAVQYLSKAAELGANALSYVLHELDIMQKSPYSLYNIFASGSESDTDKRIAYQQIRTLVDSGNAEAMYYLAMEYEKGTYREKDTQFMLFHLKNSSNKGYLPAIKRLSEYYNSVDNLKEALHYASKAAELGDSDSQKLKQELEEKLNAEQAEKAAAKEKKKTKTTPQKQETPAPPVENTVCEESENDDDDGDDYSCNSYDNDNDEYDPYNYDDNYNESLDDIENYVYSGLEEVNDWCEDTAFDDGSYSWCNDYNLQDFAYNTDFLNQFPSKLLVIALYPDMFLSNEIKEKAFRRLLKRAHDGDAEAQYWVGVVAVQGIGGRATNKRVACIYLRLAESNGFYASPTLDYISDKFGIPSLYYTEDELIYEHNFDDDDYSYSNYDDDDDDNYSYNSYDDDDDDYSYNSYDDDDDDDDDDDYSYSSYDDDDDDDYSYSSYDDDDDDFDYYSYRTPKINLGDIVFIKSSVKRYWTDLYNKRSRVNGLPSEYLELAWVVTACDNNKYLLEHVNSTGLIFKKYNSIQIVLCAQDLDTDC